MTARAHTPQTIERSIHMVRGHRVMLDADLARLYGVETKNLNKAVKRNEERFPADFMFQLTVEESAALRFQFGTSNNRGGRRYQPYAFTQEGVAMLSSVLSSKQAVEVNIEIMRVFVRLRHAVMINSELAHRLAAVEANLSEHTTLTGGRLAEHERHIRMVLEAIRQLMDQQDEEQPQPQIGFHV